jgi:hypothetical protein
VLAGAFEDAFALEELAQNFGEFFARFFVEAGVGREDGFFDLGFVGSGLGFFDKGDYLVEVLALANGDDVARALILEDLLDALDGKSLIIQQMTDAAEQQDVFGAVVASAATAFQGLDGGEAGFPESEDVLRKIEFFRGL